MVSRLPGKELLLRSSHRGAQRVLNCGINVGEKCVIRSLKIDQVQFGAKVGRHMLDFGRNPASAADRKWLMDHILDIYTNAAEFRDGTFSGQGASTSLGHLRGPVWFYAKGGDVVITDRSDNFVTILKNGVTMSTSFRLAKALPGRP